MPPRKKAIGILASVRENHWSEPSVDHLSMHSEGTKASGEASHSGNRNIMVAIEDL